MDARTIQEKTEAAVEPTFEEILEGLERVVHQLEAGELPLEQSLAVFEEGIRLSNAGAKRLDDAERRVELLLANTDGVRTRPLETDEPEESEEP